MGNRTFRLISFLSAICQLMWMNSFAAAVSINVSRYPLEMQQTYELFVKRCSTCHDLASTVNSEYVLPSYFKKMVQEMREKPQSGISQAEADQITEFLIFDAYKRQRRDLREQLSSLPEDVKEAEMKVIREIRDRYQQ